MFKRDEIMSKWNINVVEKLSHNPEKVLHILQLYESELQESNADKLEYKRQLNNLKYKLRKLSE